MPRASGYLILAALAGVGVPCLASFWAELMVFIASFKVYPIYGGLAICALVVSALFILRVVQRTCYGPLDDRWRHLADMTPTRSLPRLILAAVIVLFGFFPSLMYNLVQTASIPLIGGLP